MTAQESAIAKLRQLPQPLLQEVSDFIDFLLLKQGALRWSWFREAGSLAEAGMEDYAENLSDYEERLERGEIHE